MDGVMTEAGRKCGRASRGTCIGLSARLGSRAFSLADRIGPPPTIITGRGNDGKRTPSLLTLSRRPAETVPAGLIGRACFRPEDSPEILDSNPRLESIRDWTKPCG